jgi:hypothetical protein
MLRYSERCLLLYYTFRLDDYSSHTAGDLLLLLMDSCYADVEFCAIVVAFVLDYC